MIDMDKAKAVWRDKIRAARDFRALDVAFQRAVETGVDLKTIATAKQALRDAPADPRIDAATTLDDLKKAWPTCLTG